MPKDFLFTSESVHEGRPDRVCDQVADALPDSLIAQDPGPRAAAGPEADGGLTGRATAVFGHFGGEHPEPTGGRADQAAVLKTEAGA